MVGPAVREEVGPAVVREEVSPAAVVVGEYEVLVNMNTVGRSSARGR